MIIGVTGMMASGKSTACAYLARKYGFVWIEADALVGDLYRRGKEGYRKIAAHFGLAFVTQAAVDRSRLRCFVLASPAALRLLNKVMIPVITRSVNKKIAQLRRRGTADICIEAFFFDTSMRKTVLDLVIEVQAGKPYLLKRRDKKMPLAEYKKMLSYQRKNLHRADLVISNEKEKKDLFSQLDAMLVYAHGRL